jgi:hypothetical protein
MSQINMIYNGFYQQQKMIKHLNVLLMKHIVVKQKFLLLNYKPKKIVYLN